MHKKLAFASLGAGILIFLVTSFFTLLTYKILQSPEWMLIVMVWILAWPLMLLVKLAWIPYPGMGGLLFVILVSITIYVAVLSRLIYAVLTRHRKKSHEASHPSPPPVPLV